MYASYVEITGMYHDKVFDGIMDVMPDADGCDHVVICPIQDLRYPADLREPRMLQERQQKRFQERSTKTDNAFILGKGLLVRRMIPVIATVVIFVEGRS